MKEPTYLTAKEVAQRWGASVRTVRRLAHEGELETGLRGQTLLITIASVQALETRRSASA